MDKLKCILSSGKFIMKAKFVSKNLYLTNCNVYYPQVNLL